MSFTIIKIGVATRRCMPNGYLKWTNQKLPTGRAVNFAKQKIKHFEKSLMERPLNEMTADEKKTFIQTVLVMLYL